MFSPPPSKKTSLLIGSRPSLIPIGDSITGIGQGANGPVPYFGDNGYWAAANMMAGHPFEIAGIFYYPGEGVATIAQAIPLTLALKPTAVCIMAGTNDLDSGFDYIVNSDGFGLKWMFEQFQKAGMYVFSCGILPRPSSSAADRGVVLQVNRWCQDYWRMNAGGEYVDLFSSVVVPSSTNQQWIAGTTKDNIHPSGSGAFLMGEKLGPRFAALGKPIQLVSSADDDYSNNNSSSQWIQNPLMLGNSGTANAGFSGDIATGWTGYVLDYTSGLATAVGSLVPRADGYGNDQVLTITTTAAATLYFYNDARSDHLSWPQGKLCVTDCSISVENPINLKQFALEGPIGGDMLAFVSATGLPYLNGWSGVYRTPPQPWSDTSGDWMAQFEIKFAGAGSATLKIGRVGTWDWHFDSIGA